MSMVSLPHGFSPRLYQTEVYQKFFVEKLKRFLLIWPRRAGKDLTFINLLAGAIFGRVGLYLYIFPRYKTIRRAIWEGMDNDGRRYMDYIPKELIKKESQVNMSVTLINGSQIVCMAADRPETVESLRGMNPVGAILSEFAYMNPAVWTTLSPILEDNGGWVAMITTPNGNNFCKKLYDNVLHSDKWHVQYRNIDYIKKHHNIELITGEQLEQAKKEGMSEEDIQREYYLSWSIGHGGNYYEQHINRAFEEKRIGDFPIDRSLPVYTFWDLGFSDATAIWFVQYTHGEIRLINYYENRLEDLSHYINYLHDFRDKNGIVYSTHYSPHDGNHRTLAGGGVSIRAQAAQLGLSFSTSMRPATKQSGREQLKFLFNKLWFDKTRCKYGIECLQAYHARWNEATKVYGAEVHDWSSHACDALMYLGTTKREGDRRQSQVYQNRVNQAPIT